MAPSDEQMKEWTRRIRSSDEEAFAQLFRGLHPALVRYASRFDRCDADDLVQEAFFRLWRRRHGVKGSPSIRAYLFTVVRNLALNRARDEGRRQEILDEELRPPSPDMPDEHASAAALENRLRTWIDELPARRREAFELSRFSDLSYDEIASVMQVSPRTVESHIRDALEHLRERLLEYEPDLLQS